MVRFTDEEKASGFELMPEGVTILRVEEIKPVQSMGKVNSYKARFKDAKGRVIFNTYNVSKTNKYRTQAMRSFYTLLTKGCALEEGADGEINEQEAIGRFLVARIKHTEGTDGRVFQNLGYIMANVSSFNADISEWLDDEDVKSDIVIIEEDEDDPYA